MLRKERTVSDNYEKMSEALIKGNAEEVVKYTQEALDANHDPWDILDHGLLAGMDVVGKRFKARKMFIPEVLRCAKAMSESMALLRPLLSKSESRSSYKMVIGTVKGDLHDIGKNLVAMNYEGAGFEVVNLGIDLPAQAFVDAVKEHKPDILGLSALLTTTMPQMKTVIEELEKAGVRNDVKVIVGGAPVTAEYAKKIGADLYGANMATAVEEGKACLGIG
jgi:corrinoid protein of di/trimethylamine methyltransferase